MKQKWEGNSPKVRFTYNDKSNYYQSPVRPSPHEFSQSSIARAASLPNKTISQYRAENQSHIKIVEDSFLKQRSRKHKIFEQSPLVKRKSSSKSRLNNQTVQHEFKAASPQKTPQKQVQSLHVQTVEFGSQKDKISRINESAKHEDSKNKELDINQLNRYIDIRLVQKFNQLDSIKQDKSMKSSVNNDQLVRKDKEIYYLKLQVERLRRCEKLNKQNESLYTRLVGKLKEYSNTQTKQIVPSTSKKIQSLANSPPSKHAQNSTPISSLYDLKKLENQNGQISQQSHQNIIVNKKLNAENNTQPLKYATAPHQFFKPPGKEDDIQRVKQSGVSKAITFNNTKQTGRGRSHSRRVRMQIYPTMMQTSQLFRQEQFHNISEMPITNRLQEINSKLQRKMSRRSTSKPKKDASLSSTFYANTVSTFYSRANPRYNKFMY